MRLPRDHHTLLEHLVLDFANFRVNYFPILGVEFPSDSIRPGRTVFLSAAQGRLDILYRHCPLYCGVNFPLG
jgi:hypothetical protein